jgi:hypothetical protein
LKLFLFQLLDLHAVRSHDTGFHILDLLVEFVVTMKNPGEMVVLDLEARNQISVLREHSTLLTDWQNGRNWQVIIFPPSSRGSLDRHQTPVARRVRDVTWGIEARSRVPSIASSQLLALHPLALF